MGQRPTLGAAMKLGAYLGDLADQALERALADQKIGGLLVLADFAEGDSPWTEPVGANLLLGELWIPQASVRLLRSELSLRARSESQHENKTGFLKHHYVSLTPRVHSPCSEAA